MQVNLTLEPRFDDLYNNYTLSETRAKMLELDGINRDKLDVGKMSHAYFTKNLTEATVDQNANANESIGPNNYSAEVVKGLMKIEGYYLLWKYGVKAYDLRIANKLIRAIWDGDLYFHDPTAIQVPYCWAYSTTNLMVEGRPYGQLHSKPPKRADSFIAQVVEATMDFSQEYAGAIAPSDVLINYAWYAKKENLSDKEIVNDLQKMVHVFNNKFRVSGQSLTYSEKILINNEWVEIGDFVETHGGNALVDGDYTTMSFDTHTGTLSKSKVYGVTKHKKENDIVEVELATGQRIRCTENHSLFTVNEEGDIVVSAPSDKPKNIIVPINFANDTDQTLDISSYESVLKSKNSNTKTYGDIELDDDLMYLIGFYLGNGSTDGSNLTLSVCNKEIEAFFAHKYAVFTPRIKSDGDVVLNVGKQFVAWVEGTFGKGAHNKFIPPWVSFKANSLQVVAGYLDADGYTDGKNIAAHSVSNKLINSIQFTLQAHGMLSCSGVKFTNSNNYLGVERKLFTLYIPNDYTGAIPCKFNYTPTLGLATTPYYDLTNVKKACQKLFKQSKYNWGSAVVREDVIHSLIEDCRQILAKNLSDAGELCAEELKAIAKLFGLPNAIANVKTAQHLYGHELYYNLNTGTLLDNFIELAKIRQLEVNDLLRKLTSLATVLPIKVKAIRKVENDDEFVYDISVKNDENFITDGGIFAHNSPFTNISLFDRDNLKTVWADYYYPDGTQIDVEYVMHIQKLFGDWFSKGDPVSDLPYRFPVVTANLYVDDEKTPTDEDFLDWLSEANIDKGVFNIYGNDGTKIASCCRLANDIGRMKYKSDTFGNGGLNIGSHRVVTVNLPKVAIQAEKDKDAFFHILDKRLEAAKKLLIIHRDYLLKERVENGHGFLKFFEPLKWFSLDNFFSTIGITGIFEMCWFMGYDIRTEDGTSFVLTVLSHIEKRLDEFAEETGHNFNCEEIPGESACVTLAKKDAATFGSDVQPFALYSNQYIPTIAEATMLERIKLSGKFMSLLSGGGILHLNVSDKIQNKQQMKKLIEVSLKNGVEHFAVNYGFAICPEEHVSIAGNSTVCPICGEKIQDYLTRIIGYFTKVSSWNHVRETVDFPNRVFAPSNAVDEEVKES